MTAGRRICVTGAAGKAGRAVVADLLAHGYDVAATDLVAPKTPLDVPVLRADLTDYGQAIDVLAGAESVVHLANVPAPGLRARVATFNANTTMNFNVFHAGAELGLGRVVWASSETTLGLPFDDVPPRYLPVDEEHYPFPRTTYALSKVASETLAEHMAAWSGIPFVALRFSNILGPAEYGRFPGYWPDPLARRWNLWGYIDERDAAAACRRALEASLEGATSFVIAAADTVMDRPTNSLVDEVFPGVELRAEVGEHGSLLTSVRARAELGFEARHSWRDHVSP